MAVKEFKRVKSAPADPPVRTIQVTVDEAEAILRAQRTLQDAEMEHRLIVSRSQTALLEAGKAHRQFIRALADKYAFSDLHELQLQGRSLVVTSTPGGAR